jgi:hypothetical protein
MNESVSCVLLNRFTQDCRSDHFLKTGALNPFSLEDLTIIQCINPLEIGESVRFDVVEKGLKALACNQILTASSLTF